MTRYSKPVNLTMSINAVDDGGNQLVDNLANNLVFDIVTYGGAYPPVLTFPVNRLRLNFPERSAYSNQVSVMMTIWSQFADSDGNIMVTDGADNLVFDLIASGNANAIMLTFPPTDLSITAGK